jgi:hypothetical protein
MLSCVLCRNETLFVSNLCVKCSRIQKFMTIYGDDAIYEILNKTLLVKNVDKRITKQIDTIEKSD